MFTHPVPTNLRIRRIPIGFVAELGPMRIVEMRAADTTDTHFIARVHCREMHRDQPWLPEVVFEMARRLVQDEILDHAEVTILDIGADFDIRGFGEALPFVNLEADREGDSVTALLRTINLGIMTEATAQMASKIDGITVLVDTDKNLVVEIRMDVNATEVCARILDFETEQHHAAKAPELHEELSSIDAEDLTLVGEEQP